MYSLTSAMKHPYLSATVLLLTLGASPALSVTFDVVGLEDPNNRARISFDYERRGAPGSYYYGVALSVVNTSAAYSPRISGVAFNLPTSVSGINTSLSTLNGWFVNTGQNAIGTPQPLGNFDLCAETGSGSANNCNGGTNTNSINRGTTPRNFFFALRGTGLDSLTTSSFLNLTSSPSSNSAATPFAVRFQTTGWLGLGSDMGVMTPEPAQVLSLCIGLVACTLWVRRRQRRAAAQQPVR